MTKRPRYTRAATPPNTWPKGCAAFYRNVKGAGAAILRGTMLCVDPATGSTSQPGWSAWHAGVCVGSGILTLPPTAPVHRRLEALVDQLAALRYTGFGDGPLHLLVVEELRGRMVHPHLAWSTGVIVAGARANAILEIPIPVWKAVAAADPAYAKGDEADARAFGTAIVALARGVDPADGVAAVAGRTRTKRRAAARGGRVRNAKHKTLGGRRT